MSRNKSIDTVVAIYIFVVHRLCYVQIRKKGTIWQRNHLLKGH